MLCQECPSRSICQSECPELTLYLKEIEKPQRELTIGLPRYAPKIPWGSTVPLTKTERKIATLLAMGIGREDVCKALNIKRKTLREALSRMKGKYNASDHR